MSYMNTFGSNSDEIEIVRSKRKIKASKATAAVKEIKDVKKQEKQVIKPKQIKGSMSETDMTNTSSKSEVSIKPEIKRMISDKNDRDNELSKGSIIQKAQSQLDEVNRKIAEVMEPFKYQKEELEDLIKRLS